MAEKGEESLTKGFEKSIAQVGQVISSSLRPLATETGDGTYVKQPETTGVAKDITHIDPNDVKTLVDVVKTGATGEPVNDRDYIMERVIQVSLWALHNNQGSHSKLVLARCRVAFDLSEWQRIDTCISQPIVE